MTPKEKARQLFDKYNSFDFNTIVNQTHRRYAKQCALIAVDEMLKITPKYYTDELLTPKGSTDVRIPNCTYEYLQEVKQEIKAL